MSDAVAQVTHIHDTAGLYAREAKDVMVVR